MDTQAPIDHESETNEGKGPVAWINRARHFIQNVMAELRKCKWPTRNELIETTIAVIVMMGILTLFILGVDTVFRFIFSDLLSMS